MGLAEAARRTLEQDTARLRAHQYVDPQKRPSRDLSYREEGVTDFRLRRTRTTVQTGPWIEAFMTRLTERHPWIGDHEVPDEGPDHHVYAGTAFFSSFDGERWFGPRSGEVWAPERGVSDPLWIVERLTECDDHGPIFRVENRTGEVWLDDAGRIARVRWTPVVRLRPRAPWPWIMKTRHWMDLELYDYGVEVEIDIPTVTPPAPVGRFALLGFAWMLIKLRVQAARR